MFIKLPEIGQYCTGIIAEILSTRTNIRSSSVKILVAVIRKIRMSCRLKIVTVGILV